MPSSTGHTDLRALGPALCAILLAGAWVGRWRRLSLRGVFVLIILGLYGVVLYELALNVGYVSTRHALPPLTVALGHVGAALLALSRAFPEPRRRIALALILLAVAAIGLSTSLRPDRTDSLAEQGSRVAAEPGPSSWGSRRAAGDASPTTPCSAVEIPDKPPRT
jgi:hypothetical protein